MYLFSEHCFYFLISYPWTFVRDAEYLQLPVQQKGGVLWMLSISQSKPYVTWLYFFEAYIMMVVSEVEILTVILEKKFMFLGK